LLQRSSSGLAVTDLRPEATRGGWRPRWLPRTIVALLLLASFASPAHAITEECVGTIVSNDVWNTGPEMSGNDVYLRYGAAEYLGGSPVDSAVANYHVIAWVTNYDPLTNERHLKFGIVREYPPTCIARSVITVDDITDVNWVHHGGHLPVGRVGRTRYPSSGYLVFSDAGNETTEPRVGVLRLWETGGGLSWQRIYLGPGGVTSAPHYPVGITPSMASNRPMPTDSDVTSGPGKGPAMPFICTLAMLFPQFPALAAACDYKHRMLLVYSGDLRWITASKDKLEDPG
jgi:hypothetical protein